MTTRTGWWDERRGGGRLKATVFLLHPGPSLLVTATFVAIAGLARHRAPELSLAVRLVFVMLPIQFAIGVFNDVADAGDDARAKPYKPLPRGLIETRAAAVAGATLGVIGLAVAATVNVGTLALSAGGLAAGLLYDVGARRTPLSWLPWWGGIVLLPLAAYAAQELLVPRLLLLVPASLLVALGLHAANVLPDIATDRAAGQRSLPVLLGTAGSWRLAVGALLLAAAFVAVASVALGMGAAPIVAAVVFAVVVVTTGVARPARPFPLLAPATAVLAVVWLAVLSLS